MVQRLIFHFHQNSWEPLKNALEQCPITRLWYVTFLQFSFFSPEVFIEIVGYTEKKLESRFFTFFKRIRIESVFSNKLLWYVGTCMSFPVSTGVKNPPQETQVQSLAQEDPLEQEMASHSRILAWNIPCTHGQRSQVGYSPWGHKESDTTEQTHTHTHTHTAHVHMCCTSIHIHIYICIFLQEHKQCLSSLDSNH